MRLPQYGGLKASSSTKETESKAWRLTPDMVQSWEEVRLATGELEPLDTVIASFRNGADDLERR